MAILEEFKKISSEDSVHLTEAVYKLWEESVLRYTVDKLTAGKDPTSEKPKQFFWRGFTSPVGSERPKNLASYHANKTAGGGKWARTSL